MLANRSGVCPTISTVGHTGIPVGTEATSAALEIGDTGIGIIDAVPMAVIAYAGSPGGTKYRLVSIDM